jgi:chromosomal replication initiator protein
VKAQQELALLIDELHSKSALVVVTCLSDPSLVPGLCSPLLSRISAGTILPLHLPSPLARREIVERLSQRLNLLLTPESSEWIANQFNLPVAGFMQLLQRLMIAAKVPAEATSSSRDGAVLRNMRTLELETIQALLSDDVRARATLKEVSVQVAKATGISLTDMKSQCRKSQIVHARSLAIYLCRQISQASLEQIGKFFGNRDHTTILHSVRKIESLIDSDEALRKRVTSIFEHFGEPT